MSTKTVHRFLAATVLFLVVGAGSVRCQWDPARDAGFFGYVFRYPGHYINDHCLIRVGSLWHLYFIDGILPSVYRTGIGERPLSRGESHLPPIGHTGLPVVPLRWDQKGNEGRIGHATSPDLLSWTPQDSALGTGEPGSLDGAHVYAPSVMEFDGRYYMIYTGNQIDFLSGEHLMLATSTDLYHWKRYQSEPIFAPDTSWALYLSDGFADGSGGPFSGRDPHLVRDERYGFILYFVARLRADSSGSPPGTYSCIAAATSPDMIHWSDRGPLVVRRTYEPYRTVTWNHPESPCLVRHGDFYYLFWKGGEGTRYLRSSDPLDFTGAEEHLLATSHASEIFNWGDDWYITSCSRYLDDLTHDRSDRTQGLYLAEIQWKDDLPYVAPLGGILHGSGSIGRIDGGSVRPNPVRRGAMLFIDVAEHSGNRHDVSISDLRSIERFHDTIAALVDSDGRRVVEIPTADLQPGVYLVRVDRKVARVMVH
jgi:beta-fructofuranosidase